MGEAHHHRHPFSRFNKHGGYYVKLYQSRSYVLALENAPKLDGMYVDESGKGLSFRSHGDLLLLGGGGHRTGKQGRGWAELSAFARKTWLRAREVSRWAAQDCMSLDGVPISGGIPPTPTGCTPSPTLTSGE